MINVSTVLLLVLLLVCSFLSDAICSKWVRIPLAILIVVLVMVLSGNPFKPHRGRAVGTCISKGVNADGSYSVRIRLEETDKPLFYREWWAISMEETSVEGRRKNGKMIVTQKSIPPENRWEFLISTDKSFVPGECGLGLTVVSAPQPLEFDENGDCLHPPEPGIPARTVARKPDGTVVFTIGPEAFDLPAKRFDPPLPRSLSVYFNGALLGTIEKPSPATPSPAEETHAESAEFESHAESAEGAESGSPAGGAGERSETEGVSHAENAEAAEP